VFATIGRMQSQNQVVEIVIDKLELATNAIRTGDSGRARAEISELSTAGQRLMLDSEFISALDKYPQDNPLRTMCSVLTALSEYRGSGKRPSAGV
jgi:hypothetical protein